MGVNGTLDFEA